MKWDSIEKLVALMNDNDLEEVEFEDEKIRVRLKRPSAVAMPATMAMPTMAMPVAGGASAPAHGVAAPAVEVAKKGRQITSPFVGTFYEAPSPESASFVSVGDTVRKGDTLCIVEAMKLMNEIESDFAGKILEVLVENGKPVEFGQPLYLIDDPS